jgi:hypothetical protein
MESNTLFNRVKKSCMVVLLAAGMMVGATTGAQAVDFKAKGQWQVGFGLGNANLRGGSGIRKDDLFGATQRFRIQLDAIASENLSGRVWFEMGSQDWGNGSNGAALGADGVVVKVKNAFIDWLVPETDLKIRMGLQNVYLPNAAGGSNVFGNADVAGITASYQFNETVGLTAFWYRPANDNYQDTRYADARETHYLDNFDLFGIAVPVTLDGVEITPWGLYGMLGKNALSGYGRTWKTADGSFNTSLLANPGNQAQVAGFSSSRDYSSVFFVGLPIKVTAADPLNIEFDVNYGYVEGFGKTWVHNYKGSFDKRAESNRQGWLIKALVEYKMDWGVPGIFGWYASGDDGDVKNGSERMPSVKSNGRFTSFMGAAGTDWYSGNFKGSFNEKHTNYAGTWGVGLQLRDMSFVEDLKHTFRVALWGGTNDASMVKYFATASSWDNNTTYEGPYLTTNDNLVEFNLDSTYRIYENLSVNFDLGYIVNCMDQETWKHSRAWEASSNFSTHDAWKAQLTFNYTF